MPLSTRARLCASMACAVFKVSSDTASLLLCQQHAVVSLHRLVHQFLIGAIQLLLRGLLHVLGAAYPVPALQAVEEAPLSGEAAGEIADGRGRIQLVECEIGSGEALLPQPGAKDEDWIVAAHRTLGKHDLRHQRRAGLANLSQRNMRAGERRLVERILFQRHADGLRQRERRGRVLRRRRR